MSNGSNRKRTWQEIAQDCAHEQDDKRLLALTKELTDAMDGELGKPVSGVAHFAQTAEGADSEAPPKTGTDGD